MADFTLTIPDDQLTLVTDSLIKAAGGTPTGVLADDTAAAKKAVIAWITQTVANVTASQTPLPPPPAPPTLNLS